jgi:hypothetical protein
MALSPFHFGDSFAAPNDQGSDPIAGSVPVDGFWILDRDQPHGAGQID